MLACTIGFEIILNPKPNEFIRSDRVWPWSACFLYRASIEDSHDSRECN